MRAGERGRGRGGRRTVHWPLTTELNTDSEKSQRQRLRLFYRAVVPPAGRKERGVVPTSIWWVADWFNDIHAGGVRGVKFSKERRTQRLSAVRASERAIPCGGRVLLSRSRRLDL